MTAARATRPPKPASEANGHRPPRLYRITLDQYHRMIESGSLTTSDRCQLVHGLLVEKPLINPPHASATNRLVKRLMSLLGYETVIRTQMPITLPPDSEPEPDVVIATGTDDDYDQRHPGPKDVLLVVEVSDSSLDEDRTTQLALYAASKLPVYWIVNVKDRHVEVYTNPRGGKNPIYRTRRDYGPDDSVPVVLAGRTVGSIPVNELLP